MKTDKVGYSLRIEKDLYERAAAIAARDKRTLSSLIRILLEDYVGELDGSISITGDDAPYTDALRERVDSLVEAELKARQANTSAS